MADNAAPIANPAQAANMIQNANVAVVNVAPAAQNHRPYWQIVWWAFLRCLWILFDNVVEIPVYATLMLVFYPIRFIKPSIYWDLDSWCFREILRTIGYWIWSAGYDIVEYGDLPWAYQNDRCLVVSNHQSTADVPTLCSTICKKGVGGGKTMWILDAMFRWSNFGIVCNLRGDFFITMGRQFRQEQFVWLADHMRKTYWARDRRWFVVFPEGGFLRNMKASSQKYANQHGYPALNHCVLPRVGAVKTMIDTANPVPSQPAAENQEQPGDIPPPVSVNPPPGPGFRYLIDVTVAYQNGIPLGMDDIAFGTRPPCEIGILYRRIPIANVPHQNEAALRDFLYGLWQEKEARLAHYNQHGEFPGIPREDGVVVEYHHAGLIFHRVLFVFLAYVLYFMILPFIFRYICGAFNKFRGA